PGSLEGPKKSSARATTTTISPTPRRMRFSLARPYSPSPRLLHVYLHGGERLQRRPQVVEAEGAERLEFGCALRRIRQLEGQQPGGRTVRLAVAADGVGEDVDDGSV